MVPSLLSFSTVWLLCYANVIYEGSPLHAASPHRVEDQAVTCFGYPSWLLLPCWLYVPHAPGVQLACCRSPGGLVSALSISWWWSPVTVSLWPVHGPLLCRWVGHNGKKVEGHEGSGRSFIHLNSFLLSLLVLCELQSVFF